VHTEFVTVGRETIADIDVHGSLLFNAGPIALGVGDGDAAGADAGEADWAGDGAA